MKESPVVFFLGLLIGGIVTGAILILGRYQPPLYQLTSDINLESYYAFKEQSPHVFGILKAGTEYTVPFQKGGVAFVSVNTPILRYELETKSRLLREAKGHPLLK